MFDPIDMQNNLITAVMVTYRTGPVLFEALAAVLKQGELGQLIIVDNGNPADKLAQLRDVAEADARVLLITGHGNIGYAAACNLGAEKADHDLLLLINPDCKLAPTALGEMVRAAAQLPVPWLLGGFITDQDGREQRACRRNLLTPETLLVEGLRLDLLSPEKWGGKRLNLADDNPPTELAEIPAISGALILLPRSAYQDLGGMDSGYFLHVEDLDFFWRFQRGPGKIFLAPKVRATHLKGSSDATANWVEWQKSKGFLRYFRLHFSNTHSWFVRTLLSGLILARFFAGILRRAFSPRPARRRQ